MDANSPRGIRIQRLIIGLTLLIGALLWVPDLHAQAGCLSSDRISVLKMGIANSTDSKPDEKLRNDILSIKADEEKNVQSALKKDRDRQDKAHPEVDSIKQKTAEQLCGMLNTGPWPVKNTVGSEASAVFINLVRTHFPFSIQRDLIQVISAGVDKNQIDKEGELAAMIDRLRLAAGAPQLFGTQAASQNGFLVLWPLQSNEKVDAFRADYNLATLHDQIRALEMTYRMPLIRSTARASKVDVLSRSDNLPGNTDSRLLGSDTDEKEVTKVETSLVTIDAVVYGPATMKLERGDFKVYEDNEVQEIDVFGAADSPSDIVLLLDLSGSTAGKVGLIKKTTKQFIEMKRDVDRVSIVTFAGGQNVVSPLETDKSKLLDRAGKLKDSGESKVWDSIRFAMDVLNRDSPKDRRKAVVVMTDGVDNALAYEPGFGSRTLYADLLEGIRNDSIAVFPIYLDTEGKDTVSDRMYADARRTLQLAADDSGGVYYAAKDIENLSEVYERVLKDLGRVYSLGYEPKNSTRDGSWRKIRVEIPSHPEIKVRARSGYYAK